MQNTSKNHSPDDRVKELESEGYTILVNNEFGANIEKDGKKYYQDSLLSAMLKRNESKEITTPTETTFKIIQPKKQSFFKRPRTAIWESIAINL